MTEILDSRRAEIVQTAQQQWIAALAADTDTPWKLPRLYELAARFDRMGLRPLLDELARKRAGADLAADAFDYAWYSSILAQIRVRDPRYAAERGGALDEIADDFRQRDVEHLAANRSRVRRAWAEMTRDAEERHPLQARVIRKQPPDSLRPPEPSDPLRPPEPPDPLRSPEPPRPYESSRSATRRPTGVVATRQPAIPDTPQATPTTSDAP